MDTPSLSAVRRWAADADAQALRHDVATHLASTLLHAGQEIRIVGNFIGNGRITGSSPRGNGDDRLVAVGYVAEAASQLLSGIEGAVGSGQVYVAAALTRQMVELEYLAWAFASGDGDAATWLNSSADERRRLWQPRHLRAHSHGRFGGKDYSNHCEFGGHPTPDGLNGLINDTSGVAGEVVLTDALNHGVRTWRSVAKFLGKETRINVPTLDTALDEWRMADGLPKALADGLTTEAIS